MSGYDQGSIAVPMPTVVGSAAALAGPFKIKSSEAFSGALMTVSGLTGETISVQTSPDGYQGAPASPTFYRTDWQGTSLLYPGARTNLLTYGDAMTGAGWSFATGGTGVGGGTATGGQTGPDGTASAVRLQMTIAAGTTASDFVQYWHSALVLDGVSTYTDSFWIKSNTATDYGIYWTDPANNNKTVTAGQTWTRVSASAVGSASSRIRFGIQGNLTTDKTVDILIAKAQTEIGASATAFISTPGASAVTITDYTISGGVITLAQAPITGAMLSYDNSALPSPYYIFATGDGVRKDFAYDGVWGTLSANSGKGNGIWQIDLRGAQSYQLVKSAGAEAATVNMTLKRDALQYKNTAGTWSVT